MVVGFPFPYPDETIPSAVARYIERLGFPDVTPALTELYGRATVGNVTDLPTNLGALAEALGHCSVDMLIDEHTLWPFYAAFTFEPRRNRSRHEMCTNGTPYHTLGLTASQVPVNVILRYCPLCLQTDREMFGETYWHRSHQIPGISVCSNHGTRLKESNAAYRYGRNRYAFPTAESSISIDGTSTETGASHQCALAEKAVWLLGNPSFHVNPDVFVADLRGFLVEKGYALYSGRVFISRIRAEMAQLFGPAFLNETGCTIPDIGPCWIDRLLNAKFKILQPIRYLLMTLFVSMPIEKLLEHCETDQYPFSSPPWPCLNPTCIDFDRNSIVECQIAPTWNSHRLRGEFLCATCGMTYVRFGPDTSENERHSRANIPIYGRNWDQQLADLWQDDGYSLRRLSKILGVDPRTARRQAERLSLAPRANFRTNVMCKEQPAEQRAEQTVGAARGEWLNLKAQHPEMGRTTLRKQASRLYSFLWRHDREWLKDSMPATRARAVRCNRIDWSESDQAASTSIEAAAQYVLAQSPPVRLTKATLLRTSGNIRLDNKQLAKMPQATLTLNGLAESRVEFAKRRLLRAEEILADCHVPAAQSRLLRLARISSNIIRKLTLQGTVDLIIERLHSHQQKCASATQVENCRFDQRRLKIQATITTESA
jgi:Tn7-like transposition protein D/TniQ